MCLALVPLLFYPRQRENSPAACALLLAVLELGRIVNNLKKCKKVAVE